MSKKEEDISHVYGGFEEFDDFKAIQQEQLYELRNLEKILEEYHILQQTTFSNDMVKNLESLSSYLKNNINVLKTLNLTISSLVEKIKGIIDSLG